MNNYNRLIKIAESLNLDVIDNFEFEYEKQKGCIVDQAITLSKNIKTESEKTCILAEEIAHYKVNYGDITNLKLQINKNRELRAHKYAIQMLVPFMDIVRAVIKLQDEASIYSVALELGVTESFLKESIDLYQRIYSGSFDYCGYHVQISPFRVTNNFI